MALSQPLFYVRLQSGERLGPLDSTTLKNLALAGKVKSDSLLMRIGGSGVWHKASVVRGLVFAEAPIDVPLSVQPPPTTPTVSTSVSEFDDFKIESVEFSSGDSTNNVVNVETSNSQQSASGGPGAEYKSDSGAEGTRGGNGAGRTENHPSPDSRVVTKSPGLVAFVIVSFFLLPIGGWVLLGQWRKVGFNFIASLGLVLLICPGCFCCCLPVPIGILATFILSIMSFVDGFMIIQRRKNGVSIPINGYQLRPLWVIMRFVDKTAVLVTQPSFSNAESAK